MVKLFLDIDGISWYPALNWNVKEIPAVGDVIVVDKSILSPNDQAKLRRIPSNQVFRWADPEDNTNALENFDYDTEMVVTGRLWKYSEEDDTKCILTVDFQNYEK